MLKVELNSNEIRFIKDLFKSYEDAIDPNGKYSHCEGEMQSEANQRLLSEYFDNKNESDEFVKKLIILGLTK